MASTEDKPMHTSEQIDLAERVDHVEVDHAKERVGLSATFTAEEERACLRKIDFWLMPMMVITYGLVRASGDMF